MAGANPPRTPIAEVGKRGDCSWANVVEREESSDTNVGPIHVGFGSVAIGGASADVGLWLKPLKTNVLR